MGITGMSASFRDLPDLPVRVRAGIPPGRLQGRKRPELDLERVDRLCGAHRPSFGILHRNLRS
jgi:hypothetical protein